MTLKHKPKCHMRHVILGNCYATPLGFACLEHKDVPETEEEKARKMLSKAELLRIKKEIFT